MTTRTMQRNNAPAGLHPPPAHGSYYNDSAHSLNSYLSEPSPLGPPSPIGLNLRSLGTLHSPQNQYAAYNYNAMSPRSMDVATAQPLPYHANDPVSKHLLVETALYDSRTFEILPMPEVEALKQENEQLETRIEVARRKLAMESKVRDAAQSLHRLYSTKGKHKVPHSPSKQRKGSLLADRSRSNSVASGKDEPIGQAGDELATSEKKIEELVKILNGLENRRQYIAGRLLRHTAAVLQAAHHDRQYNNSDYSGNGPASDFGDGLGLGKPLTPDDLLSFVQRGRDYDESVYSNDQVDGLRDINGNKFKNRMSSIMGRISSPAPNSKQSEKIKDIQRRLELLNGQMRTVISQSKRRRSNSVDSMPDDIPSAYPEDEDPIVRVESQLEHMETGLRSLVQEQIYMKEEHERALDDAKHSEHAIEGRLEGVNSQLFTLLSETSQGFELQPPPQIDGHGAQEQINYIEDTLMSVEQILQDTARSHNDSASELAGLRAKSAANAEKASQYETVLLGLWDIISSDRSPDDIADDDDDDEDEDDHRPREPFSLQAFNTRVQHMFDRAAHLDDQTSILRRQIAQQRELADRPSSTDVAREQELEALRTENAAVQEELEAMLARHAQAELELRDRQQDMLSEVEQLRQVATEQSALREQSVGRAARLEETQRALHAELEEARRGRGDADANADADVLAELEEQRERVGVLEERLAELEAELEDQRDDARISGAEAQAQEQELLNTRNRLEKARGEMVVLEGEVARLATELTVAKAELDGAYGSRAERAKEVAMTPEVQMRLDKMEEMERRIAELAVEREGREQEIGRRDGEIAALTERHGRAEERGKALEAELASLREEMGVLAATTKGKEGGDDGRVALLERELKELADELQELTRESVELEKEREQMEQLVDGMRDRCDALEGQLSDERVRWLGIKSPSMSGEPAKEMTSTMVLRNEFKKMMRETRADGVRLLRAEQEERRRLEGVVRSLRRENMPSRNGLSPRPYLP